LTTTTKIFIILVCLFAFIFTPLVIGYMAQNQNWKQLAQGFQDQAENETAFARSVQAINASEAVHHEAVVRQLNQEKDQLNARIGQLTQELADRTAEKSKLALASESQTKAGELQAASLAMLTKNQDLMTKSNADLRSSELDLQTRNAELLDKVKELTANVVVLTQQLNQRAQEVAIAREENENLRKQQGLGRAGEYETGGTPSPTAKAVGGAGSRAAINGQVKAVQGNLVTIDVGSSSGVKQGMTMVVYRDRDWVCDVTVTSELTPTEAVAEIKQTGALRVRSGDKLQDEVTFNAQARS
jgi:hypothetical protein